VLTDGGVAGADAFRRRAEELLAGAHEFVEVRVLNELRSGELRLPEARAVELERLLGAGGHGTTTRLGVAAGTPRDELRSTCTDALGRWRRLAGHPLADRSVQVAAAIATRTLEGMLARELR
jgi:hypothetical protein